MIESQSISVVLCTYNGAPYIAEQLQSIVNQTCKIAEIVVVDDCSTDGTVEIAGSFANHYLYIKVHRNEKQLGAIKNFEKALRLAQHEVIAIADQDDVWHPKKIEKLMADWPPTSPLIYCNSVRFNGTPDFSVKSNPDYLRFFGPDGKKIMLFNTISGHAVIIRKKILDDALPFNENVMYDWWLGMIAAYNGGVSYVPEVLVLQRVHENNLTVNNQYNHRNPESRKLYKAMLLPHLKQFSKTPGMLQAHKIIIEKLYRLFKEAGHKRFSFALFLFLFKHRRSFFYFQKKKEPLFSHIKYSLWFSTN